MTKYAGRTINRENIYIRKLISINKSKGIVLPARFVKNLGLSKGEFLSLELDEVNNSITVEKIGI